MKNPYDLIVKPIITEKTVKLVEEKKYTFEENNLVILISYDKVFLFDNGAHR